MGLHLPLAPVVVMRILMTAVLAGTAPRRGNQPRGLAALSLAKATLLDALTITTALTKASLASLAVIAPAIGARSHLTNPGLTVAVLALPHSAALKAALGHTLAIPALAHSVTAAALPADIAPGVIGAISAATRPLARAREIVVTVRPTTGSRAAAPPVKAIVIPTPGSAIAAALTCAPIILAIPAATVVIVIESLCHCSLQLHRPAVPP